MKVLTKLFFLLIAVLLFLSFYTSNVEQPAYTKEVIKELEKYTIPIKSISPHDTNFTDLEFLKKVLENKRIVCLGESTHDDASTFLAKTRLIKFLHEKLGYTILLWESGLYDIWYMNQHPLPNGRIDSTLGIFSLWTKPCEVQELWNYLSEKSIQKKSIQQAGFDLQLSGSLSDSLRTLVLKKYLVSKQIEINHYPTFASILNNLNRTISYPEYFLRATQRDSLLNDMEKIVYKLKQNKNRSLEDEIYIRYIAGMAINCNRIKGNEMTAKRIHIRDFIMAENSIWLIDTVFPNEKIIVWAANMHILYNNKMYVAQKGSAAYTKFTSMGDYLKKKYQDDMYVLCFSSFANLNKRNILSDKGNFKSLEYFLHQQGYQYAFIDFSSLDSNSFLNKELTLRANQNVHIPARWSKMLDGLFFIDTMKKAAYNE